MQLTALWWSRNENSKLPTTANYYNLFIYTHIHTYMYTHTANSFAAENPVESAGQTVRLKLSGLWSYKQEYKACMKQKCKRLAFAVSASVLQHFSYTYIYFISIHNEETSCCSYTVKATNQPPTSHHTIWALANIILRRMLFFQTNGERAET